ncbi:hypothetical protein DHEL01_v203643 [Diaporthe helianthi]|uniref:Uncharacterized protein n=1 Tax=Diaporthe helianthi TaxID=158607 RepID=A0A2P5I668_DIAHE|nr:hypothetical protein DHEL01_v203643 [Diaporthe helianthi]
MDPNQNNPGEQPNQQQVHTTTNTAGQSAPPTLHHADANPSGQSNTRTRCEGCGKGPTPNHFHKMSAQPLVRDDQRLLFCRCPKDEGQGPPPPKEWFDMVGEKIKN